MRIELLTAVVSGTLFLCTAYARCPSGTTKLPGIISGSCHQLIPGKHKYKVAKKLCDNLPYKISELASPMTDGEVSAIHNFVSELYPDVDVIWLAYERQGSTHTFINRQYQYLSTSLWLSGEPDDSTEHCSGIQKDGRGTGVIDVDCNDREEFVVCQVRELHIEVTDQSPWKDL